MKVLTAFYDLQFGPVSYDFATWLVRAMFERDRSHCERLHVVVVPHETGLGGFAREWGKHDAPATYFRLWHIIAGCCPLARASLTIADSRAQAETFRRGHFWWPEGKAHFMGPLVKAARAGENIPLFRATEQARHHVGQWLKGGLRTVTLTMRDQMTDPDRNSDGNAWRSFAQWLLDANWHVIRLNDTNTALSQGHGYAELDPDLRLALYERAHMNIIGNNGPQELLKFSSAPYIAVGQALTDGWKDHFRKYFAMEPGEQLPWAKPNQRLVYEPDTFETLRDHFVQITRATTKA